MKAIAQLHSTSFLLYMVIAVVGLIVLIARYKVNSVIALVLASLFIGLCAGMEPAQLLKAFREGVGSVLGSIAMILGLGSMLGKMLAESGGGERIDIIWRADAERMRPSARRRRRRAKSPPHRTADR